MGPLDDSDNEERSRAVVLSSRQRRRPTLRFPAGARRTQRCVEFDDAEPEDRVNLPLPSSRYAGADDIENRDADSVYSDDDDMNMQTASDTEAAMEVYVKERDAKHVVATKKAQGAAGGTASTGKGSGAGAGRGGVRAGRAPNQPGYMRSTTASAAKIHSSSSSSSSSSSLVASSATIHSSPTCTGGTANPPQSANRSAKRLAREQEETRLYLARGRSTMAATEGEVNKQRRLR